MLSYCQIVRSNWLSSLPQVSDDPSLMLSSPILGASVSGQLPAEAPCSAEHHVQLLQKQLQQQEQQALAASAQVVMRVDLSVLYRIYLFKIKK